MGDATLISPQCTESETVRRPIRIANCAGAKPDSGIHMLNQTLYSNADVITGDYLAEMNLASNATAFEAGTHPGYEETALGGLTLSLKGLNEKRIKVVINGGALNPKGLAERIQEMVDSERLSLKIAWVSGDDLLHRADELLSTQANHLDSTNPDIKISQSTLCFLNDRKQNVFSQPLLSANAYLGARAITKGLREGADIVICGRVSDASPVIGAAQWWHGWSDTSYDELAGALVAGHLIECSTYSTGGNFAGFYKYSTEDLLDLSPPVAEIDAKGEAVITKAEKLRGYVTKDVITCQLLYELQGDIYLNSCVKADLSEVSVEQESENRVHVKGVRGLPPPPTTKFAVFYQGGYQCEITINATGYATSRKYDLFEAQMESKLEELGVLDKLDVFEFQRVGIPAKNPSHQLQATTYLRMFAQALEEEPLRLVAKASTPLSFPAFFPGVVQQSQLHEAVHFLGASPKSFDAGHPPAYEELAARRNYQPTSPVPLSSFGETAFRPLGDVALARSGDKGANVNIGLFVHTDDEWDWLRSFLTTDCLQQLMGEDWRPDYFVERVEFPHLKAVHFVIYGPLGRGVSSSSRLDALGKAFAEFIRARYVHIPKKFLTQVRSVE
ncbi:hypothetical protein EDD36DRAFT_483399 [Exophiala viscosa]|uniref:DUF1446 domain protein n=1 Tax=Exophiala viscosa TaxID=2486360 RepID=A0AAN6DKH4_9EURO|nr:hypothetical protein EDD36DRAFT_483399 [Exophiala viscosa]